MSEFDLIAKYFTRPVHNTDLGVGDDAALIQARGGFQLAVSSDMLVAGTHFFHDAAPYDIGWKALAVNVSDMAAMGAQPKWATLAIALPEVLPSTPTPNSTPTLTLPLKEGGKISENWLAEFSRGFFACAEMFKVDLIGGDTTRGSLNISVTIMGEVPIGKALRRDGAQVGDDIWLSGQLGGAALALAHLQGKIKLIDDATGQNHSSASLQANIHALLRPMPRADLGLELREIATSAIDISDGLAADLGHILKASKVGAELFFAQIPTALEANKHAGFAAYVLAGGDDYELCFTAPPKLREKIEKISLELNLPIALIGNIHAGAGLVVLDENKQKITIKNAGYDHFS